MAISVPTNPPISAVKNVWIVLSTVHCNRSLSVNGSYFCVMVSFYYLLHSDQTHSSFSPSAITLPPRFSSSSSRFMPITSGMETTIENVHTLLNQLQEKVDKQETMLLEILQLLKKHTEIPHVPNYPTAKTLPLGGPFAE